MKERIVAISRSAYAELLAAMRPEERMISNITTDVWPRNVTIDLPPGRTQATAITLISMAPEDMYTIHIINKD